MEDVLLEDPNKFMSFLQECNDIKDTSEAQKAADIIEFVIKNLCDEKTKQWMLVINTTRQTTLSLAFRCHRKLISKHNLTRDWLISEHILDNLRKVKQNKQITYEILYAYLQSEDVENLNGELLLQECLKGLNECEMEQEYLIYTVTRTVNLLLKKLPTLNPAINLSKVYAFLQLNQQSIREEVLIFFTHCCKNLHAAQNYFKFIVQYYTWTHRNKYLLLSCILQNSQTHKLEYFLEHGEHSSVEFFEGLRLSLAYKRLLSPSQYLIKALSRQESLGLLELAATIMTVGTLKEITSFHANWFGRITQKETLLKILYERLDIEIAFKNLTMHSKTTEAAMTTAAGSTPRDQFRKLSGQELSTQGTIEQAATTTTEEYRFVLIFSMYCRQIYEKSKLDFFRISTELITNCFRFQLETQLLIYKFIVENLNFFALEDILEFLATYIVEHKSVENAQIRNTILSKFSTIINYIAKTFRKTLKKCNDDLNTLNESICMFFGKVNQLIENEIESKIYQPKIYTLRLLEISLKSLYQEHLERNAKNCILIENEQLGRFLISKGVFDSPKMRAKLVLALNDPTGFDDALDLIAQLLKNMDDVDVDLIETCKKCCESVNIDECNMSSRYANVILNASSGNLENFLFLQNYALNKLNLEFASFQKDPLYTCKKRCHIFGFINLLNASISNVSYEYESLKSLEIIELLELIVNLILELLLKSPTKCQRDAIAASFQDIDESLEILVKNSHFHAEDKNEDCRKFLLMSFWLTLKACCDAATTLANHFANLDSEHIDSKNLQRCININIAVLTRCRHKGAIEAAGISIGKLTKQITSHKTQLSLVNKMLCEALSTLFKNENFVSTTRRGAGFSIMLLHIVKNDEQIEKPILRHAMFEIFQRLQKTTPNALEFKEISNNYDRIEALCLHYLCVLAKDAELRDAVALYRNEIILAAIKKIDDPDWTICNAALQLFGALVPKIVGQKQAMESELIAYIDDWEPACLSFAEIAGIMPETFQYIINYCKEHANESRFTRSIILFLGFLSKLEHLAQDHDDTTIDDNDGNEDNLIKCLLFRLRELMWSLLRHREEKVRKLSALVFVRAHEFRHELPQILLTTANILFRIGNENFFEGLIFVLQTGFTKIRNEALHTMESKCLEEFLQQLRAIVNKNYVFKSDFKTYTNLKLLEMFLNIGFDSQTLLVINLLKSLQVNAKDYNSIKDYNELFKKLEIISYDAENK